MRDVYYDAFRKGKNDGYNLVVPPEDSNNLFCAIKVKKDFSESIVHSVIEDKINAINSRYFKNNFASDEIREGYKNGYFAGLSEFLQMNNIKPESIIYASIEKFEKPYQKSQILKKFRRIFWELKNQRVIESSQRSALNTAEKQGYSKLSIEDILQTNDGILGFIQGIKKESPVKTIKKSKQMSFHFPDIHQNFQNGYIIGFMAIYTKEKIEIQKSQVPLTQKDYDEFLKRIKK